MNSLIHAFEGMTEGTIYIHILKVGDTTAKIIFHDTGKGIPIDDIEKIFTPFFTTRRGQGGSGLGLNIVYNLVSQTLKGSIRCESFLGKGTTFTLLFPCNL